jgi:predicted DNA-binding transcriptional regulator AlpA
MLTRKSTDEIVEAVREKVGHDVADELDAVLQAAGLPAGVDQILSRTQVARILNTSVDTLDRLHERGEAPPRFRMSPKRWGYPASGLRRWQQGRLRAAEAVTP